MNINLPPPIWVDTDSALSALIADLNQQTAIAVDTESNSLFAYREQVCLIQFSTPERDYLVDPFAFSDLSLLRDVFIDPHIEKVFHAAEYDLICLKRDFGISVRNLFDTRWAVRILGYAADGLNSLLSEKFSIHVDKKYQKANWAKRPLKAEQINYARLDTHYLLPLKDLLRTELEEKNLTQLAFEDFTRASDVELPKAKSVLWERMGVNHSLTPRELTILKELYECREQIAKKLDRPTFKVVGDKRLLEIAQSAPRYPDELSELGMSDKQVDRWGKAFLQAVQRGQQAPLVRLPRPKHPDEAFLSRLDALKMWRKHTARKMGVESDVILPRSLMEMLAEEAPQNIHQLTDSLSNSPWRTAHFGSNILMALKG